LINKKLEDVPGIQMVAMACKQPAVHNLLGIPYGKTQIEKKYSLGFQEFDLFLVSRASKNSRHREVNRQRNSVTTGLCGRFVYKH